MAIILDYFNEESSEDGLVVNFSDIESFRLKWLEFDTENTHWIQIVDLGLLLSTCGPPLVAVKERERDGLVDDGGAWVRPTIEQLEKVLEKMDCPEHNGKVHFLEVLLSLLQNITGVVSEEQIMSDLLRSRPLYWDSIRAMPKITGFTADPFIKDAVMLHLRKALQVTRLP